MAELWQALGSLLAVIAVVLLVRALRLGADPLLPNEEAARAAAAAVDPDFSAVAVAVDPARDAALLLDARGRVLVMRAHGSHVAGRLLGPGARAEVSGSDLVVDAGDRWFGRLTLSLDDPQHWKRRIDLLSCAPCPASAR
ncbi:hypothetical protein EYB45_03905 [Erythrobacteraceae bacterium CFH 75059]|uniref:hypothetical protein n=1 Tax=Qipengyuania thermophila TaxID=2509361 RepID=UPI001020453B|nr:hypothetical protein [Qipengyuania thermophila]TCD06829.1 hypothetical protein EYB45_03905 [Erythrobacteraceae bacterium CFH 75059]